MSAIAMNITAFDVIVKKTVRSNTPYSSFLEIDTKTGYNGNAST